jgi:hypothetical protein
MKTCVKCGNIFEPKKGLINYCSLECRNSRVWTEDDKKNKSIAAKNSEKVKNANKKIGLMNHQRSLTQTVCLRCQEPIIHNKWKSRKYHKECWLLASGGYRENSTIKHKCFYKGVWMDSGSEKEFAIKCDEHNILWEKNRTIYFEYIGVDEKKHKYYPDFYLKKSKKWVEIKGKLYANKDINFEKKISSVDGLVLIYSKDIKKFDFGLLV